MKWIKTMARVTASLLLLFALSCAISGLEAAAARGGSQTSDRLVTLEAEAREAEKNAASSWFPQQYWEAAYNAYNRAARAAVFSGQLQKAISYGEKALEMAEKTKEPIYQRRAIVGLIAAYKSVRNFDKVRELIDKELVIAKEIRGNTIGRLSSEGHSYLELGTVLMRQREYHKAIDSFSQSLYAEERLLVMVSSVDWRRAPRTAAPTKLEALKVLRRHVIDVLIHLGDAYREAGEVQQAMEQYQRAFDSIKEWGLKYSSESDLYAGLGETYLRQKNFSQALGNFQKALALAEKQRNPTAIISASRLMGAVFHQTGRPAESISYFQKAIDQIESTRSLLQSEEFRQSFFEGGLGAYLSMVDALIGAGRPEDAFNYSERARARIFLDVLGTRVALSRVKGGLLEEERALQERIASIKARLASGGDEEQKVQINSGSLQRELREAEAAYGAFLQRVRKQDKEQASLMTVEPLTLKEVQELLDPGTTLIEYFVTPRSIYVWVVERDGLRFVTVELPREKLSSLVKTLRETIFTLGEREKLNEVSGSLYKQLVQPLLPHVKGRELVIVPHDVLHYLPFHALLASDGHYLIEKYPIYYLSSASLLQFTTAKREARGDLSAVLAQAGSVLAFGNPDLGDPAMNLRFAELEAGEIAKLYPRSSVLLKKEATEEKAKAFSAQNDILHFATHAELSEEDPLSSAILLAKGGKEDGRLEVREIFGMDLHANLVVLSACETGLGKLSSGDELVGLTRAFIYAGTPSVVASLWNVEDSSTAALMASFYKNLRTMTKVEALRQAQLELIRGGASSDLLVRRGVGGVGKLGEVPQAKSDSFGSVSVPVSISTSHPYFWAPFILVGDGN